MIRTEPIEPVRPMRDQDRPAAPNYTNACIVMFGVNIAWIFMVIWAIWGLVVVMVLGAAINHLMTRLENRAHARAAERRGTLAD